MSDMSKKYYKIVSLVNGLLGITFSVVFVLLWFNLIFDIPFDDWWFGLTPFFLFVFNFLSVLFFIFLIHQLFFKLRQFLLNCSLLSLYILYLMARFPSFLYQLNLLYQQVILPFP